jgi:hypothetical protein
MEWNGMEQPVYLVNLSSSIVGLYYYSTEAT